MKRILSIILVFTLIFSSFVGVGIINVSATNQENLVADGNFELSTNGTLSAGWTCAGNKPITVEDATQGIVAKFSSADKYSSLTYNLAGKLTVGKTYCLSFRIKRVNATQSIDIDLRKPSDMWSKNDEKTIYASECNNMGWVTKNYCFTVTDVNYSLLLIQSNQGSGENYIDDIRFTEVFDGGLIKDGGFDNKTSLSSYSDNLLDTWMVSSGAKNNIFIDYNCDDGSYIKMIDRDGYVNLMYRVELLELNKTYKLTFKAKQNGIGTNALDVEIRPSEWESSMVKKSFYSSEISTEWTELSMEFTVTDVANTLVYFQQNKGSNYCIDDIRLEKVDEEEPPYIFDGGLVKDGGFDLSATAQLSSGWKSAVNAPEIISDEIQGNVIQFPSSKTSVIYFNLGDALTEGTVYCLSFKLKRSGNVSTMDVDMRSSATMWEKSAHSKIVGSASDSNSEWVTKNFYFTCNDENYNILWIQSNGGTGSQYIDDVRLVVDGFKINPISEDEEKGLVYTSATECTVGGKVTLNATAQDGYKFIGWYNGEDFVSNDHSIRIIPKENINYVAKFDKIGDGEVVERVIDEFRGNAIRTKGAQGLRFKYAIPTEELNDLIIADNQLVEYGYVAVWERNLPSNGEIQIGAPGVVSNSAYEIAYGAAEPQKDVFFEIDKNENKIISLALYNIGYDKTFDVTDYTAYNDDMTVRSYMKYKVSEDAEESVVYGDLYTTSVYSTVDAILSGNNNDDVENITAALNANSQMTKEFLKNYPIYEKDFAKTVSVTAENGTAFCSQNSAVYGESVNFTAIGDNSDSQFIGWFDESGNKVSGNISYTVNVVTNIKLTAKFTEGTEFIDTTSDDDLYTALVTNGNHEPFFEEAYLYEGNTALLKKQLNQAKIDGEITVVGLGGSITQGAYSSKDIDKNSITNPTSYAQIVANNLSEKMNISVDYRNHGIGATGADLGIGRLESEVLTCNPDLVIIDFTANQTRTGNKQQLGYEAIIRTCLEREIAVIAILYGSVQTLASEKTGAQIGDFCKDIHLPILMHYGIPTVDFFGTLWEEYLDTDGDGVESNLNAVRWEHIYYDKVHPNANGHRLAGNAISYVLNKIIDDESSTDEGVIPVPYRSESVMLQNAYLYDSKNENSNNNIIISTSGAVTKESIDSSDPLATSLSRGWNGWKLGAGGTITFKVRWANSFSLTRIFASNELNSGTADIYINGKYVSIDTTVSSTGVAAIECTEFYLGNGASTMTVTVKCREGNYYIGAALISQAN